MIGNCCYSVQALFNSKKLTWTQTGKGKADPNSEEGWTLLPDGTVLTADVSLPGQSERYDPSSGSWSSAGSIPVNLVAASEIGPQTLRPDGTVFVAGATGHTATYSTTSHKWSAGPDFPIINSQQYDVADGPATLLPDGHVLIPASPGIYQPPSSFFEFDGKHIINAATPPGAVNDSSFNWRLLILPTGEVLGTDGSNDVEVYTPRGKPLRSIAPQIVSVPTTLTHGSHYTLKGRRLNGVSQDNMYGDDVQMASNYPLVRITNTSSGHVFYARTYNFSSMAVASKAVVKTTFQIPNNTEVGAATLQVVTNGITSTPVTVTIQ
ncbi:MAG: hypothetical protein JO060_07410 [Candidatus Eremiobacteraeota bacterium]|nr:hypothetical protein [Candidatus Eremiobacteraeota bacterium]